jgi:hypothetical protein
VGREHGQARVLERDEAHQHVAVIALAADLLRVDARGLVAMVAVGDQQLGVGERPADRLDRVRVADAPETVQRAVVVFELAPGVVRLGGVERIPSCRARVGVEREDRREVGARRARQTQAVLARSRVGALVRADPTRPVLLDADPSEEATPPPRLAVGAAVALLERPHCRLGVAHQYARSLPGLEQLGRVAVGVLAVGQVDLDDVAGRACDERRALLGVDHVVGRGGDVAERADLREVVVQRSKRLDVRHRAAQASGSCRRASLGYPARPWLRARVGPRRCPIPARC